MRRLIAVITSLAFLFGPNLALAGDHLVAGSASQARLAQAAAQRQQDLVTLERVLETPAAATAAATVGVPIDRVQAAVPALGDGELRDLAARAAALTADPAAGYHEWMLHDFLTIFLVLVLVVAILNIADHY